MKSISSSTSLYSSLKDEVYNELQDFIEESHTIEKSTNRIKIDLHCHDYNSNVPDELIGRILNVPETWTKSKTLFKNLDKNNVNAYTITNHNNTRSCYEMIDKGYDVLIGAEFSCMVPDYKTGIHVLTYGFDKKQEEELQRLRNNIYDFQRFTCQENIPTIWAHPLYHYKSSKALPPIEFFEKLALIFERFEVINGQRDSRQNMLVKAWLDTLTIEKLDLFANKHKINFNDYCRLGYKKVMTGGSDSHMGLFAGQSGVYLPVDNLKTELTTKKSSEIALEAIRTGNIIPFGTHNDSTKLIVALLDYVCQIAINRNDPGLMRIVLHKGSYRDKLVAVLASNAFAELQHHKTTMRIIELIHNSIMGKKPKLFDSWLIPNDYKYVFNKAVKLSELASQNYSESQEYSNVIYDMYYHLNTLLFKRLDNKLAKINFDSQENDINKILNKIELPSDIREYLPKKDKENKSKSEFNITDFLDGLSFPFLSAGLLLAANFTGVKAMYNNRKLLDFFSNSINKFKQNKKILWLIDEPSEKTDFDKMINYIAFYSRNTNLPIEFITCSNKTQEQNNLLVISPVISINNPIKQMSKILLPVFLEAQRIFEQREYSQIICSSNGILGVLALYLKSAFSVPAAFVINDEYSLDFAKKLQLDAANEKRLIRLLRFYYSSFDKIITTNQESTKWINSKKMAIPSKKIIELDITNQQIKTNQTKTNNQISTLIACLD